VRRWQGEAPLEFWLGRVVDLHDAGRRLLLEPLPRVTHIDAGPLGEFPGRAGAVLSEYAIEAQPVTEVDREHIHRGHGGGEQSFDEGIARLIRGGHRNPLPAADTSIMPSLGRNSQLDGSSAG
jgi:hypothetical protein